MLKRLSVISSGIKMFVILSFLGTVSALFEEPAAVVLPVPDLSMGQFIGYNLGHRPCRKDGPRLEPEWLANGKLLIHNYGHGGAGFSLAWGYANEVARIIAEQVALKKLEDATSVAIIGAGVIGMSVAHTLLEQGFKVRIYADAFTPDTTSNVAVGIFSSACKATGAARVIADRAKAFSAAKLEEIAAAQVPLFKGVSFKEGYSFTASTMLLAPTDDLRMVTFGVNGSETARKGRRFVAVVTDVPVYLQDLFTQTYAKGADFTRQYFTSKEEVSALPEPIIINCTGMGAKTLFGDNSLYVDRGEMLYFKAQPGIDYVLCYQPPFLDSKETFVMMIPWQDRIIVSGSHEGAIEHYAVNKDICNKLYTNIQKFIAPQATPVALDTEALKVAFDCNVGLRSFNRR